MNRNQFISTLIRSTLLAVMAGLVVLFVKRDNIGASAECGLDFQCKKCNKIKGCTLPEADNFKKNG